MLFINMALVAGLAAVAVPVLIHILNRRTARPVDWGAMRFLLESVASRRRRIELEEVLLMVARCLLLALLALALARPFVPPGSDIPWAVALPLGLVAVVLLGASVALWGRRRLRWGLLLGAVLAAALVALAVASERRLKLGRFAAGDRLDVALVIDASASMELDAGAGSNFELALAEAAEIVARSGGGDAFSVVLAGPVPAGVLPAPVSDREAIAEALGGLAPVGGSMAARDALAYAALGLSRGYNPNKQIVLLTDGQSLGWELDRPARWESLQAGMATLPTEPQLVVRRFALPERVRNVAVSGFELSRAVVGTDRPVAAEVTVENTGSEAVTPAAVELEVAGEVVARRALGQIAPGVAQVVSLEHQFAEGGSYPLVARVVVEDDLASDDEMAFSVNVRGELGVLLVDGGGRPAGRARGAAFAALALAPGFIETGAGDGGVDGGGSERSRYLVEPEVVAAAGLPALGSLDSFEVIVLADVPRLPAESARQIARFVAAGGGLLVVPGPSVQPGFYNSWRSGDGEPVFPGSLGRMVVDGAGGGGGAEGEGGVGEPGEIVSPSPSTFVHPALALLADPRSSDLGQVVLSRFWEIGEGAAPGGGVVTGGRLTGGEPFLTERALGDGSVIALAAGFDPAGSNLVTRQAFVPLVHELVYYLSNPGRVSLNLEPGWEMVLNLSAVAGEGTATSGLVGHYFRDPRFGDEVFSRIDPAVDFGWGGGSPAAGVPSDRFSARWTGAVRPEFSEEYSFSLEADDEASLWLDGKKLIDGRNRRGAGEIELEAGRWYDLKVEYREGGGNATVRLVWSSPSQPWQVVPPGALSPFGGGGGAGGEGELLDEFVVVAPGGGERIAEVGLTDRGRVVRVSGPAVPGLYRVDVPGGRAAAYAGLLDPAGEAVPFTVGRDPAESRLEAMGDGDTAKVAGYLDLLEPASVDEVMQILEGKEFGEELWRYLAVGAFVLLLAEVLLTRWITKNRAEGEDEVVGFEIAHGPGDAFNEQLERFRASASTGPTGATGATGAREVVP